MTEPSKAVAAFGAALCTFLLLPVTMALVGVAALFAIRRRRPWHPGVAAGSLSGRAPSVGAR